MENIETLVERVNDLEVKPATPPQAFTDLPLSQATQSGLEASHFKTLTTIQANAIPAALKGRDILGAARTGSGKTLAFLVPVLEILYRRKWGPQDGLGALIISPTRELVRAFLSTAPGPYYHARQCKYSKSCVPLAVTTAFLLASSSVART